ncbi:MAG: transcription-repair coupling factor [Bacteroidales bacterium]|nr:transcription-repair coupling factor [Lachnoclostridium sp.]MCM1383865.1 transcription-repair coupling factor [Lachnoclostridium sp.]MCM1464482.1 transcription-repair coupling factor [Bacteroidales bacterium]
MQALLAPLTELAEYGAMKDAIKKPSSKNMPIALTGCVDSQKLHMIYGLSDGLKYKVIVTYSDIRAKEILEEYRFYDRNVMFYPAKDLIFFQADIHGNRLTRERICTLRRLMEEKPVTIVTTFAALMSPQVLWNRDTDVISIERGDSVNEGQLAEKLVAMGYEKTYQVESPGQFSIRGGIVDIFDLTEENPYRIELWGDDVDSIRSFDVLSQRSIENLESISIYPATEFVLSEEKIKKGIERIQKEAAKQEKIFRDAHKPEEAHRIALQVKELSEQLLEFKSKTNLESYVRYFYEEVVSLPEILLHLTAPVFFIDEPARIREQADAVELEFRESMEQRVSKGYILPGQMQLLYSGEEIAARLLKGSVVTLAAMESKGGYFKPAQKYDINVRSVSPYNNSFEALVKDLKLFKKKGCRVLLLSGSRTRAKRLAEDLREQEFTAVYTEDPMREVLPGEVLTYYGYVGKGFEYPLLKFVVLTETDIFGAEKKKKKKKHYQGQKINDFNELKVGDYVVHETHGLGIYRGIEKVEIEKTVKDYIKIEYRDGGNLYVLATGLDVIQKYASADAKRPKLNKLGSKEWERTKTKVRSAVNEVARDLVELYALRQQTNGYQYGQDTVWQREFEEMFPFEETEDQVSAIADTKADMESTKIMDRLICGDVGYGKTEIAIRAAFKAVQEGKQVAYLVPTTILAQQHYNTFLQRMKDFPVRIDLMSRFRTAAELKKTAADLQKGMVDIVIGTHRVLSNDVQFKDLGLLVIDEEQRFGVAHKEKIKKLKENVDVLTLTATPIPRTLHMSLVGIRDMSVLEEAPGDRLPIQTFVCEYNEEMVREAISRELARGGQVYYVYNRVNNIADITAQVAKLMPEATVAFAHGQMKESELEQIMYNFINGEIDVLVSTTIIETGLDISNVNTMIIHDSDNMGLSQLYQLRGRVGRSNRTAYAFLMYKRDKMLKEAAEKRLAAIREFTDLGSGFKIAMRDLEIRGAGNLLGMKQHGHMEAVGYDLYCKMLNEAVQNLKGLPVSDDFPTTVDLDVDAYIPPEYIVNEIQKLDIYKRITGIENLKERDDMKDELLDRFGEIPKSVDNLLRIALIRVTAHTLDLTEVKGKNEKIIFTFRADANIEPAGIPEMIQIYGRELSFTAYEKKPYFTFKYKKTGLVETDAELLLEKTEELLGKMKEIFRTNV